MSGDQGARLVQLAREFWALQDELVAKQAESDALWEQIRNSPPDPPEAVTQVGQIRPLRPDHTDGGSTFHFTPIGDSTATLPAVMSCPNRIEPGTCPELHAHVHYVDGSLGRLI
jgi:hypothetical protein